MICFGRGEVGNFAAKCPNRSDGNSKGKKGFQKFNKQGSKRKFLSKEYSSSYDDDSDNKGEANERVLFMAKHSKQEVSKNEEEGLTIEEFYKEAIKLIKELKAERSVPILLKNKFKVSKLKLKNTNALKGHFKRSWKKATKKRKN